MIFPVLFAVLLLFIVLLMLYSPAHSCIHSMACSCAAFTQEITAKCSQQQPCEKVSCSHEGGIMDGLRMTEQDAWPRFKQVPPISSAPRSHHQAPGSAAGMSWTWEHWEAWKSGLMWCRRDLSYLEAVCEAYWRSLSWGCIPKRVCVHCTGAEGTFGLRTHTAHSLLTGTRTEPDCPSLSLWSQSTGCGLQTGSHRIPSRKIRTWIYLFSKQKWLGFIKSK